MLKGGPDQWKQAQLVAYIGGLGHFTAIVANFAMSLGLALSKSHLWLIVAKHCS